MDQKQNEKNNNSIPGQSFYTPHAPTSLAASQKQQRANTNKHGCLTCLLVLILWPFSLPFFASKYIWQKTNLNKPTKVIISSLLFVIFITIFVLGLINDSSKQNELIETSKTEQSQANEQNYGEAENRPMEKGLATINAGQAIEDNDPTIDDFAKLLDSIEGKTPNTRQQIADMTTRAYQIALEEGETASLYDLMSALDLSIPEGNQQEYKEIVALFLVARKNQ